MEDKLRDAATDLSMRLGRYYPANATVESVTLIARVGYEIDGHHHEVTEFGVDQCDIPMHMHVPIEAAIA